MQSMSHIKPQFEVALRSMAIQLADHCKRYDDEYDNSWSVVCYIWYIEDGPGRVDTLSDTLLAEPNVGPNNLPSKSHCINFWHCVIHGYEIN